MHSTRRKRRFLIFIPLSFLLDNFVYRWTLSLAWLESFAHKVLYLSIFILTALVIKNIWANKGKGEIRFIKAVAVSLVLQETLKLLFSRARPDAGLGPLSFFNWGRGVGFDSFPSGHTLMLATISFVLYRSYSSFLYRNYSSKKEMKLYMALPFITGISRILQGRHWISDIVVSLALAWWISYIIEKN